MMLEGPGFQHFTGNFSRIFMGCTWNVFENATLASGNFSSMAIK